MNELGNRSEPGALGKITYDELLRLGQQVKATGLDADASIDLLVAKLGKSRPEQSSDLGASDRVRVRGPASLPACPAEVCTSEVAKILGVSKDTVLKLREEGLLPYRNAAPPTSTRPVFRFLLEAVLKLRTDYQTEKPNQPMRTETQRRRVKGASGYKHLKLGDD